MLFEHNDDDRPQVSSQVREKASVSINKCQEKGEDDDYDLV